MSNLKSIDLYNLEGELFRVVNGSNFPIAVDRWEARKGFVPAGNSFGNLAEVEYKGLPISEEESKILMI